MSPQQIIVQPQSPTMNAQAQSPAPSMTTVQAASTVSIGTASSNAVSIDVPQAPTESTVQFQQVQIPSQLATPPGEGGSGYFVLHAGAQIPQALHMHSLQTFNAQFAGAGAPNFVNAACIPGVFAPQGALTPPASPPAIKEEKPAAVTETVAAAHSSPKARPSFLNQLARTITAPAILEGIVDVEIEDGNGSISADISADISSFNF
jgi:hypothetical protein